MLSERANRFLASRQRIPTIPTERVIQMIQKTNCPVFDSWIAFHDQYAGYVESLGGSDVAFWGLAHEQVYWMPKDDVEITADPDLEEYEIQCAEVHPSYGYTLNEKGEFRLSGPGTPVTESFDKRVEQLALQWALLQKGEFSRTQFKNIPNALAQDIQRELEVNPDPIASDRYSTWALGKDWAAGRYGGKRPMRLWVRASLLP